MKNIPEDAKTLLDALTCTGHVATGLSEIKERCDDGITTLRKQDVTNLELYVDTLHHIEKVGRQKVQNVCAGGSHVLKGYNKIASENRKKEEEDTRSSAPLFIRKLREFRDTFKKGFGGRKQLTPANNATRCSGRQMNMVTPDKSTEELLKEYNGHPRYPDKKWTRTTLCYALKELDEINAARKDKNERTLISQRKFMENVVEAGKSTYNSHTGIFRMYSNWLKSEDGKVPEGRGRPSAMELDEVEN